MRSCNGYHIVRLKPENEQAESEARKNPLQPQASFLENISVNSVCLFRDSQGMYFTFWFVISILMVNKPSSFFIPTIMNYIGFVM
jgi:hypothetical protein